MVGIALGVMVLITVLSVMNGFDFEIRNRIFEMAPQIAVRTFSNSLNNWKSLADKLVENPEVIAAAPFVEGQGMLTNAGVVHPAMISGIDPIHQGSVSKIGSKMVEGKLSDLKPTQFGIVLGQQLANSLALVMGAKVTLITPEATLTPVGVTPRFKRFTVVGIFRAGNGFGFDSQLAFINIHDAQTLYQLGKGVSGIRLKIKGLYQAPQLSRQLAKGLHSTLYVTNWTQQYGPLFKAISLEKNMMFLILILIIAVAAFNLVSSLVMVVSDKRADIAILRTFGATPRTIMSIFIVQGVVIGLVGTLIGLLGGVELSLHVTEVVNFIQKTFHIQLLSANVYYMDFLPSRLMTSDVLHVTLTAFALALLATLYPAWRAARTQPAEALRYE